MTIQIPAPRQTWRVVRGVQLLGPATGSGLTRPTNLVRRGDGQVIQISELLNLVLESADRGAPAEQIARRVSDSVGRELTLEGLEHLIDTKLAPLGLIEDGSPTAPRVVPLPAARPLLALQLRGTILPAPAAVRVARWLAPLFVAPVVVAACAGMVAVDVAIFLTSNPAAALDQVLVNPILLLALFALLSLGALIHELGHAAACAFGGARPGRIGFGLYVVFPAYFTDVTDSYRLGRAGRLRTDLGGLYFNTLCVVAAGVGYLTTGSGLLLLVVIVMQLQMLQQLPPTIRLDGYFILADLAGVPDLFSRLRPVARSLVPGREMDPRVAELRPAARRIVRAWVLTVVPLLVGTFGWMLWTLPVVLDRTVAAIRLQLTNATIAWAHGQGAEVALSVISVVLLALPVVGLVAILARLAIASGRWLVRRLRSHSPAATTAPHGRTTVVSTIAQTPTEQASTPGGLGGAEATRASALAPGAALAPTPAQTLAPTPAQEPDVVTSRTSFIVQNRGIAPALAGWRGFTVRATGLRVPPSAAEREHRRLVDLVSTQWQTARTVAVVNGKGGVGKTVSTAMLSAVFARYGGGGVLAWDNNDTRGTLGWRTERAGHDATVQDLLPEIPRLTGQAAQYAEIARFVHHQVVDKYDVLRSNPELLAETQRISKEQFDELHELATKYYRLVFFDSGNDESALRWLRMIDLTDQLVVATTTQAESAESGALLLEALGRRSAAAATLARNAVVVVLRAEHGRSVPDAGHIADGFRSLARAVVTVPFDQSLHAGELRYDWLNPGTRAAWLTAAGSIAEGI